MSETAERLLSCECGHGLDEHNGLGCYARLSYDPPATCDCVLTDNRTHADLLAMNLAGYEADIRAAAWDMALVAVTAGVKSAMEAHREHGHRQIVAALSGLVTAVPKTHNPFRAADPRPTDQIEEGER